MAYRNPEPERNPALILLGLVLLIAGLLGTFLSAANGTYTYYYGAILSGTIALLKGIIGDSGKGVPFEDLSFGQKILWGMFYFAVLFGGLALVCYIAIEMKS